MKKSTSSTSIPLTLAAVTSVLAILFSALRLPGASSLSPVVIIGAPCFCFMVLMRSKSFVAAAVSRSGVLALCFATVCAVNMVADRDVFATFRGPVHYVSVPSLLGITVSFMAGCMMAATKRLRYAVSLAAVIAASVHAAFVASSFNVIHHQGTLRSTGLLSDPNVVTLYTVPPLAFAIYLASSWRRTVVLIALSLLVGLGLLMTVSKTALSVTALTTALVLALIWKSRLRRKIGVVALVGGAPMLALAAVVLLAFPDYLAKRIENYTRRVDASAHRDFILDERLHWIPLVASHDPLSPERLLGTGTEGQAILPHNSFVDAYLIGGYPGVILLFMVVVRAVAQNRSRLRTFPQLGEAWRWSLACVTAVVALSLVVATLSLLMDKVIWLVLGLATGPISNESSPVCSARHQTEAMRSWIPLGRQRIVVTREP